GGRFVVPLRANRFLSHRLAAPIGELNPAIDLAPEQRTGDSRLADLQTEKNHKHALQFHRQLPRPCPPNATIFARRRY
ncbi:hypothetical protein, partial [Accumulibacter sp.]|uniref:hypothetical protein n=1 Tax=Accumulibacter sp. TaxID=2053492 RepID=UPI0025C63EB3